MPSPDAVWFHLEDGTDLRTIREPSLDTPRKGDIVRLMRENSSESNDFVKYKVTNVELLVSDRMKAQIQVRKVEE